MEDNFLMQLVREPMRGAALLDLLFTNRESLVGDVEVRGCLGQSDHDMVEFSILGGVRRGNSKIATLDFRRADFELFGTLVGMAPWESILKGKGLMLLTKEVLQVQEQEVPICHKAAGKKTIVAEYRTFAEASGV